MLCFDRPRPCWRLALPSIHLTLCGLLVVTISRTMQCEIIILIYEVLSWNSSRSRISQLCKRGSGNSFEFTYNWVYGRIVIEFHPTVKEKQGRREGKNATIKSATESWLLPSALSTLSSHFHLTGKIHIFSLTEKFSFFQPSANSHSKICEIVLR